MFRIIGSTAKGESELPDWPDISDLYGDIVQPLLLYLAALAICVLPAGIYMMVTGAQIEAPDATAIVLILAGIAYFPMALLGVALNQTLGMLSPTVVIPAILRAPVEYCAACLVLLVIVALSVLADSALVSSAPLLGWLLARWLALYFMAAEMRVLGVLYYTKQDQLGWFRPHR